MKAMEMTLLPLLVVLCAAFIVPVLLSRLKRIFIPVVVGEILAGMLLGKSGLGFVEESSVLTLLANLGFIFLMFLSGLEISLSGLQFDAGAGNESRLRRIVGSHLGLSLLTFSATLGFSFLAAILLCRLGYARDIWIIGLILSTTSLGVVVPVLKENGTIGERFGQMLLYCALVADFGTILLISFYVLIVKKGVTAEVLLVLILFAAFTGVYRLAAAFRKHLPAQRFFEEISSTTSQIQLRGALALVLVFAVLANSLGVEMILGAFLAGVIISMLTREDSSVLREKLDALGYGFLIPIFFIKVGADFNLPALLSSGSTLAMVPVLLLVAIGVKLAPAAFFIPFYSWREAIAGGLLLTARLSLIIAAAMIGREIGLITDALNSAIILLAVITCTLAPLLFKYAGPPRQKPRDRVVLIGCRHFVNLLGKRLRDHDSNTVIVCADNNNDRPSGTATAENDRTRESVLALLRQAGAERAHTLVALEEKDADNLTICRMARSAFDVPNLISWVDDTNNSFAFRSLGVRIVNPAQATLLFIETMAINPDFYNTVRGIDGSVNFHEVKLKKSPMTGKLVKDLGIGKDVTVIGISRGGEWLLPDNQTRIQPNDTLTLVGSAAGVEGAVDRLRNRKNKFS